MSHRYWRYRAYNAQLEVCDGVMKCPNFVELAIKLRQDGLQLLSASTIDRGTYRAELLLQRWQAPVSPTIHPCTQRTTLAKRAIIQIRRIISWFNLFLTK